MRQIRLMEDPVAKACGTAFARPRQVDDADRYDFSCCTIVPQVQYLAYIVKCGRHSRNVLVIEHAVFHEGKDDCHDKSSFHTGGSHRNDNSKRTPSGSLIQFDV